MAIMQVKSTNPNFSMMMLKHPQHPMHIEDYRKGKLFGWYTEDAQGFNVFFKDGDNDMSFIYDRDQKFEFINTTKYTSPSAVIGSIDAFFRDPMKKPKDLDTQGDHEHTFMIQLMYIRAFAYIENFQKSFPEIELRAEEVGPKVFRLEFKTKESFSHLLNCVQLFAMFAVVLNGEIVDFTPAIVKKYTERVTSIDSPYYIRYLFKKHFLRKRSMFSEEKKALESTSRYEELHMEFGGTLTNRIDQIRERLDFDRPILDVGCGEGNYVREFAGKIPEMDYIAIDPNEIELRKALKKAERKGLTNVKTLEDVDEFLAGEAFKDSYDVLLTEVIEHMEVPEAQEMVTKLLESPKVQKLIVTTPCREFNAFYAMSEGEFRHEDHHFEFDRDEWGSFLEEIKVPQVEKEEFQIGDIVNGIPTSFGVVFKKRG